ncbi:hypothetical protein SAMD00019534_124160 [Acytostelium subglobosum LB1]|uniref:hypothetical protein n=1 Tax=Acytostelium subglobosum LB1 TaxID=1410327 RepID=UPI000644EA15|nr:hypothetical protein SAMD00019534_124160 [Acytostelium subglobosum LB1]GAM29240.1 hypothetical protein SAMD00019534_124160 [Acytostelium subglobosum LB1]|eukprot:XP_012747814.1 hypothetical protein SAMD00019534_124160 [Acytostelium subglobosum LB1]
MMEELENFEHLDDEENENEKEKDKSDVLLSIPYPLPTVLRATDKNTVNRYSQYLVVLEGYEKPVWVPSTLVPIHIRKEYDKEVTTNRFGVYKNTSSRSATSLPAKESSRPAVPKSNPPAPKKTLMSQVKLAAKTVKQEHAPPVPKETPAKIVKPPAVKTVSSTHRAPIMTGVIKPEYAIPKTHIRFTKPAEVPMPSYNPLACFDNPRTVKLTTKK